MHFNNLHRQSINYYKKTTRFEILLCELDQTKLQLNLDIINLDIRFFYFYCSIIRKDESSIRHIGSAIVSCFNLVHV